MIYKPFLLGHSTVDIDSWKILFHKQLRKSHTSLHTFHEYDHLRKENVRKI